MNIIVKVLDPIDCEVSKIGAQILAPLFEYPAVYYRPGQYHKKRVEYKKSALGKSTDGNVFWFYTGFLNRVRQFCQDKNIDLITMGSVPELEYDELHGIHVVNAYLKKTVNSEMREDQLRILHSALVKQRGMIQSPAGSGKTVLAASIIASFNVKTLYLLHNLSLIRQTVTEFKNIGLKNVTMFTGEEKDLYGHVVVATVQSMSKLQPTMYFDKFDVVVVDECFVGNTFVNTSTGLKKIKHLNVEDLVYTSKGINKITHTFINKVNLNKVVKLSLSNGKIIYCSDSHLFATDKGWQEAKNLVDSFLFCDMMTDITLNKKGDTNEKTKGRKNLSLLWEQIQSKRNRNNKILFSKMLFYLQKHLGQSFEKTSGVYLQKMRENYTNKTLRSKIKKILFQELWRGSLQKNLSYLQQTFCISSQNILFKRMFLQRSCQTSYLFPNNDKNQFKTKGNNFGKNETKQSFKKSINSRKNKKYKNDKGVFTCLERRTWGKWKTIASSPNAFSYCFAMGNGSACENFSKFAEGAEKNSWFSNMLQDRYWKREVENRNRSRWKWSQVGRSPRERQNERPTINRIRVESVEIYRRGNNEQAFSSIIGDTERNQGFVYFYDLEVEKSHDYFVEGVLVHNCHRLGKLDGTYSTVLKNCLATVRLGFTATLPTVPEAILATEGLLGPLVDQLSLAEGIEKGILATPKIKIVKLPMDHKVKELRKYQDVYDQGVVHNEEANKIIINTVRDQISAEKTVLILVTRIDHGENLMQLAHVNKIKAYFAQGATGSEVREKIRNALSDKQFRVVIATTIWFEGINIPSLDVIVNASGGKSEIRTLQAIGRGLRATKDKDKVLIVDFFNPSNSYLISHFGERISLFCSLGWM